MAGTLGRFGDRRLEKGGPIFWIACSASGDPGYGFVGLEATGPARSGLGDFYVTLG